MEVAHIDAFRRDPARFWSFYRPRLHSLGEVEPNPAHEALAELERRGLLEAVITQNIDMLHRKAGSERVIEVHGSIRSRRAARAAARSFTLDRGLGAAVRRRRRRRDLLRLRGPGEARRRPLRRAAPGRGDGRGGGARRPRRPDALRRLLARGLPGRRAALGHARPRRATWRSSPRARPRTTATPSVRMDGDVVEELEAVPRRPLEATATRAARTRGVRGVPRTACAVVARAGLDPRPGPLRRRRGRNGPRSPRP